MNDGKGIEMPIKPAITMFALALALALAPPAAWAFSSGGSSSSSASPSDFDTGKKAADSGDYEAAIASLTKAVQADPTNADAYNLLGFSYRKLDDVDKAFENYYTALELDRGHRGANEYIGELYLELGDLAMAEEHLGRLGKACFYACEEYQELKQSVAAYRASQGS